MSGKEDQLIQLLSLMARSMTHMTASVTAMSFEQLRSQDAALQSAARRMIERMQAINEELDQQWELISQLSGQRHQEALVEELEISSVS
jgi:Na+-translocating ferredoxin:NAD+ oxidoreductase RnfG subunit